MRISRFPITTSKETPAQAEIISHQLMLRAGLVRQTASGLYTWLPLGLRVLKKVEAIIRTEMDKTGAAETLMPVVQPAELWEESGRWEDYGPELLRLTDRHDRRFCLGPTHEEVITDLFKKEIRSHKQLPVTYYQIQTKFRDEIRPRFGIMRAREFLMKDAYSFHLNAECLNDTYREMHQAYSRIFARMQLKFRAVQADSGAIGGQFSHEFHVLADSGEDEIVFSENSDYAANVEQAESLPPQEITADTVPALIHWVAGTEQQAIALLIHADDTLNEIKAEKLPDIQAPLIKVPAPKKGLADHSVIADFRVALASGFSLTENINETWLWGQQLPTQNGVDIRNVQAGDPSPDNSGPLSTARGIEVGHIFQLGTKYSESMHAQVASDSGQLQTVTMGCYGIGVSRIVAAAIEQNHDDNGIIWPTALAPFQVMLIPLNLKKSAVVAEATENTYRLLSEAGIEVLLDDRDVRPGVKFADAELIGIPNRVVIGDRGLANKQFEYKGRNDSDSQWVDAENIVQFLQDNL